MVGEGHKGSLQPQRQDVANKDLVDQNRSEVKLLSFCDLLLFIHSVQLAVHQVSLGDFSVLKVLTCLCRHPRPIDFADVDHPSLLGSHLLAQSSNAGHHPSLSCTGPPEEGEARNSEAPRIGSGARSRLVKHKSGNESHQATKNNIHAYADQGDPPKPDVQHHVGQAMSEDRYLFPRFSPKLRDVPAFVAGISNEGEGKVHPNVQILQNA
mmetsp:Transcript_21231/g.39938  ORF Transcript_21231/g.39938 Transcript_21231/m.39938 type:complete len:210 (+) Transcript_21231:310-939(+)